MFLYLVISATTITDTNYTFISLISACIIDSVLIAAFNLQPMETYLLLLTAVANFGVSCVSWLVWSDAHKIIWLEYSLFL